ncbi:MAG: hypothetical protein ABR499_13490 [Gemmatimonadaceae bacterium]
MPTIGSMIPQRALTKSAASTPVIPELVGSYPRLRADLRRAAGRVAPTCELRRNYSRPFSAIASGVMARW